MRVALFFVALMSAVCAPAPRAQAWTMSLDPVTECVLRAAPGAREACIDAFAGPCLNTDAGVTTAGAVACLENETRMWAELRDAIAGNLRSSESPIQSALLDAALAQHERWVSARCAYAASIYEGGSLARVVAAACRRDTIAEHALELHARSD
jgi:hypothetical protein